MLAKSFKLGAGALAAALAANFATAVPVGNNKNSHVVPHHGHGQSLYLSQAPQAAFPSLPLLSSVESYLSDLLKSVWRARPHAPGHHADGPFPPPADAQAAANLTLPRYVVYGDSYNQGALGVPDPHLVAGFNVYNIAFWTTAYGPADNALLWVQGTDAQRKLRVQQYHNAGIKLMISVFGETDAPQASGADPVQLARTIANFTKTYQLDGVDVDYEEFDLFETGASAPWIISFTKELRKRLPAPYIISHAPVAPWFSPDTYGNYSYAAIEKQTSGAIDFYNVQFYNQGAGNYDTCDGLIWESTDTWPSTSLFEIAKYGGVSQNKLVIGKPANANDASNGYMSKQALGQCYQQALENGWQGGLMFWEYPDITTKGLAAIQGYAGIKQ